jgi:hypothetical protein
MVSNKIYILANVYAHIERCVDLISELGLSVPTLNTTVKNNEAYGRSCIQCSWEVMGPYSPHLAPSDFHLPRLLKKHPDGKKFATC